MGPRGGGWPRPTPSTLDFDNVANGRPDGPPARCQPATGAIAFGNRVEKRSIHAPRAAVEGVKFPQRPGRHIADLRRFGR
jgi:hypothetical protein